MSSLKNALLALRGDLLEINVQPKDQTYSNRTVEASFNITSITLSSLSLMGMRNLEQLENYFVYLDEKRQMESF